MNHAIKFGLALAALSGWASVQADQVPVAQLKQWCASGYVGPRTTYGETKEETANKAIMYKWVCMTLVDGQVDKAFELYVSKDFCDHSHMVNAGRKECANYDETLTAFKRMSGMLNQGGKIEFPVSSTVNGEMVTQWGAGADIFRVHDGKITDHWDASPPVNITMTGGDENKRIGAKMQAMIDSGTGPAPLAGGNQAQ